MHRSTACDIAQTCLLHLMQDTEEFSRFANITGIEADHIRAQINNEDFLRGILEYVLNWEPLLNAISVEHSISNQDFKKAQHSLMNGVVEYQSM